MRERREGEGGSSRAALAIEGHGGGVPERGLIGEKADRTQARPESFDEAVANRQARSGRRPARMPTGA